MCCLESGLAQFYALPILNIPVPQFGQTPLTAGFPFLRVTFFGFFISRFFLHLTQYACTIISL
jgi:hypothetical protein